MVSNNRTHAYKAHIKIHVHPEHISPAYAGTTANVTKYSASELTSSPLIL